MKKLLVLMLVLSTASLASAAAILTGPGTGVEEGTSFDLVISGTPADITGNVLKGGVYSMPVTDAMTADSGVGHGLGNLGAVKPYSGGGFVGWDYTVGQLGPKEPDDFVADPWSVVLSYIAGAADTSQDFGLFDYDISFDDPIQMITVNFTPEPMTMALLGLGGLFLRRRK